MFPIFKIYKKNAILISVLLFILSLFCYGFLVEPKGQHVKYDTVRLQGLPTSWENAKIAFFSDLNIGEHYTVESLKTTVQKINATQPDMIIFAGRFFDTHPNKKIVVAELEAQLLTLHAPLGKYALLTADETDAENEQAKRILAAADFQILTNEQRHLYRHDLEPLNLIAINKQSTPEEKNKLFASSNDTPSLLLNENVDDFADLAEWNNIQFMLSYSTYGGYIGIPYVNTFFAKTAYPSGIYHQQAQTLLVSTGIGTPYDTYFRLFNYPTIYIITIQNQKN